MIKVQHIETDPLAPDTIEEVLGALERIIELTGRTLGLESYQKAKDYLHQNPSQDLVLDDPQLQSKYGGKVVKAASGYKEYRKIAKYFAVKSLITYCKLMNYLSLSREIMGKIASLPLYTAWENIGGQIIPQKQVELLFEDIKKTKIAELGRRPPFLRLLPRKLLRLEGPLRFICFGAVILPSHR